MNLIKPPPSFHFSYDLICSAGNLLATQPWSGSRNGLKGMILLIPLHYPAVSEECLMGRCYFHFQRYYLMFSQYPVTVTYMCVRLSYFLSYFTNYAASWKSSDKRNLAQKVQLQRLFYSILGFTNKDKVTYITSI